MVEKKAGATQTCSKCGTDLICKLVTNTWKNKTEEHPQWQNKSNGEPHYMYVSAKNYDCNVPKDDDSQEVQTQEITVTTNTASVLDKITAGYVDDQITLIQQIEKRVFEVLGADTNVAKVGMYVKLILEGMDKK